MRKVLSPYVGVGSLRFGMAAEEVESLCSQPLQRNRNRRNEIRYNYGSYVLVIADRIGLVEITFYPEAELTIAGMDAFRESHFLNRLIELDSSVGEYMGVLISPLYGVTLSGFHNEEGRTVTAFSSGRMDDLLPKFTPYK